MFGLTTLLTGFFLLPLAAYGYTYENPLSWVLDVPQCAGIRQSPIDLDFSRSQPLLIYPLTFNSYDIPLAGPVQVENNGNTLEFAVGPTLNGFRPFITGGGLNGVYEAVAVHFHWGSPQIKGSEHAMGGQKYDLEMHIVHKNVKFPTIEEARNDPFGLAVLGVLFKEAESAHLPESGLRQLLELIPYLTFPKMEAPIRGSFTIGSLLANVDVRKFFTYRGSLTTPPCSQAVTWIVFEDIQEIEPTLLHEFWKLRDARNFPIVNNFRPLQLDNGRKVFSRKFLK